MQKLLSSVAVIGAGTLMLATASFAQPSGTALAPKSGTRLITLGTRSGPTPTSGRAQSSNLLVVNGTPYVIDTGEGVTRRLTKLKTNFRNIGTIFITHPHSDHTEGLGGLLSVIFDANRTDPVNVYGPPGTAASVHGLIEFLTVNSEIRISDGTKVTPADKIFSGHDTGAGTIFQDANVKVTAVENTHFHFQPGTPPYGKYKSYSYRFETPERVVFFTGDTGPSDAVVELAKGADLYVTETTSPDDVVELFKRNGAWQAKTPAEQEGFLRHMHEEHVTPEDIGKMAAKAGVKAVVMTHIGPSVTPNDDYQRFVDEAKKYYAGPITLAKDLMKF